MQIMVTGAAGFIGSHLVEEFSRGDNDVVGFDNFLTGRRENVDGILELDILERSKLYELANAFEPEVILHCAASYSDPDLWHRDAQTNVEGAINVAIVAKHYGAHVVYPQTILPPVTSYAISKIAGEQYLRQSEVPLTVLRLANVYGPRNISGPIPVFYKRITEGLPCVAVDTSRDFLFIDDLVYCVKKVVNGEHLGTFDVCTGIQTPIFSIFERIAKFLHHDEVAPLIPPDPDDVQGTVSRKNAVPGWFPATGLPTGITKTLVSYRQREIGETHTHLRLKG